MDISPKLRLDDDYADDTFGDDSEEQHFLTNFRSSNDRFQQKFQQAQHDANERQVEQDLDRLDSHEKPLSEKEWRLQEAHLHRKLVTVEKNIKHLQQQLTAWKEKRQTEASLAQLTPAERAAAAAASQSSGKPAQDGLTTADVNSIFTYLFEVGEMPLHPNAAGLNEHTAVYARDDMKQQAFMNPQVLEQQEFSNITFTEVQETFDRAPAVHSAAQSSRNTNTSTSASQNEPDNRPSRHCLLRGRCHQCNFRISFVVDPTLKVEQLDFELDIDIQLDARSLLKEIKKSNNLLALFRLIRHYGRLEKDKFDVFAYIKKLYVDSSIKVTQRDAYELEFSSDL
ncbi:hypothetical protein BC940DRAFT_77401 [Gongronella butleri]|nr:hypothetical protein BC940DRAFT_77401 [Gongronella butleri]